MDILEQLFGSATDLPARLRTLHQRMLERVPGVARVAVTLYEPRDDLLKTFINSTRVGSAIAGYEYRLADSQSLSHVAASGVPRVIDNVQAVLRPDTAHSRYVLDQGYRSSYTVPMYDGAAFLGMIFFDAMEPAVFTPEVQRDLTLYCGLMNMAVVGELAAVRSIAASVKVARDFAGLRDFETGAHLDRMSRYARLVGRALASSHGLTDNFIEHLYLFAPLHDVGKIGIPDAVLLKPGKLTDEERRLMQTHVIRGVEVVHKVLGDFSLAHLSESTMLVNIVHDHHEFLDGSGYPRGLRGKDIPIEARIVTVADIFDALTSGRPYKTAWPTAEALTEMDRMVADGKLDADCVAALHGCIPEIDRIRSAYRDGHQEAGSEPPR